MQSKAVIACYGMGITQHRLGTDNVQQLANLFTSARPISVGPAPAYVRCEGTRTSRRPDGRDRREAEAEFLDRLGRAFGFDPPRADGHNVVHAVEAMLDDRVKVFIGMGGNFVAAVPDKPMVEGAMRKLRLTVGVTTKLTAGISFTEERP